MSRVVEALDRWLARGLALTEEVVRDMPAESESTPEPDFLAIGPFACLSIPQPYWPFASIA